MEFDAYYEWLGIPPHEQPPNHYRLLGLAILETNPSVISSAADRQMLHLRSFQHGPHAAQSQQLLNEVSAARLTLLNVQKKAEYDQRLVASIQLAQGLQQAQKATGSPAGSVAPESGPASDTAPSPGPVVTITPRADDKPRAATRKRGPTAARTTFEVVKIVVGAIAGLSIAILALWVGFRRDPLKLFAQKSPTISKRIETTDKKSADPTSSGSRPTTNGASNSTAPASVGNPPPNGPPFPRNPGPSTIPPPVAPSVQTPPSGQRPPNKGVPTNPPANPSTTSVPPTTPPAGADAPTAISPPSPAAVAGNARALIQPRQRVATNRAAVPAPDSLTAAQGILRELFKSKYEDIVKLKVDERRTELAAFARELSSIAADEAEDPKAYATYDLALKMACGSGDVDAVQRTVQEITGRFDGDEVAMLTDAVRRTTDSVKKDGENESTQANRLHQIAQRVEQLASTWEGDRRFADASRLWEFLATDDGLTPAAAERSEYATRRQTVADKLQQQTQVLGILDQLAQQPDNPGQQTEVANYLAFQSNEWAAALPFFARGADLRLKTVAELELRQPQVADAQIAVGDAWWELFEAGSPQQQDLAQRRASYWYRQASNQARGLVKVKIDERLARLEQTSSKSTSPSAPASKADPAGTIAIALNLGQERTIQKFAVPKTSAQDRVSVEIVRTEGPMQCRYRNGRNVASLGTPLIVEFEDANNVWLEVSALRSSAEEVAVRITPQFRLQTNQEFPFTLAYLEDMAKNIESRIRKAQVDVNRAKQAASAANKVAKDTNQSQLQRNNAAVAAKQQTSAAARLEARANELLAIRSILPKAMDYADKLNGKLKLYVNVRSGD